MPFTYLENKCCEEKSIATNVKQIKSNLPKRGNRLASITRIQKFLPFYLL